MLDVIDACDKWLSEKVHKLDSVIVSGLLFPFALVFNPIWIVIPMSFMFGFNAYVLNRDMESSLVQTLFYIFTIVVSLVMTLVTKKLLNRKRPVFLPWLKYKSSLFRSKESNCSLPSGDSIQAMNFAIQILFSFQTLSRAKIFGRFFHVSSMLIEINEESLTKILIAFVALVMLARVYFMCHFFLDTILGAAMSFLLTTALLQYALPEFTVFATQLISTLNIL